ncbi:MAG: hypothetical protein IVW53_11855 [Chloroflexi bacterium]|nr:hypothetical protein [Chloroflexota bacterium]
MPTTRPTRFMLLVYRMPARPTANRVYVWRMLKKLGAVHLQQSVTVFPQNKQIAHELEPLLEKITDSAGEYHLLPLRQLPAVETEKLVARFVDQTARHYEEIIENCEINFTKEIEFETFRRNFTYEEAEEIRIEYEKIVGWFERVSQRDWFGAPNRDAALGWLERCLRLLEGFEAQVFRTQAAADERQSSSRESPAGRSARRPGRRRRATSLSSAGLRVAAGPREDAADPDEPDLADAPDAEGLPVHHGRSAIDGGV